MLLTIKNLEGKNCGKELLEKISKEYGIEFVEVDPLREFFNNEGDFRIENTALNEDDKEFYDNLDEETKETLHKNVANKLFDYSEQILDSELMDNIVNSELYRIRKDKYNESKKYLENRSFSLNIEGDTFDPDCEDDELLYVDFDNSETVFINGIKFDKVTQIVINGNMISHMYSSIIDDIDLEPGEYEIEGEVNEIYTKYFDKETLEKLIIEKYDLDDDFVLE